MAKQQKLNEIEQRRQFRAEQMQKAKELKRKQNRIMILIIAVAVLIAGAVAAVVLLIPNSTEIPAVSMDDLDFTEANIDDYIVSGAKTDHVLINVSYTNKNGEEKTGNILVRLFDEVAPNTVENFKDLVHKGFYTKSTFHRIVKDFMIQGGAQDNAASKDLKPITGEFTANGFTNNLLHKRGVISMARSNDPNSATSDFFIMHKDSTSLDGKYASFGYVVAGMNIVDEIAEVEVKANPGRNNEVSDPVNAVTINSIQFAMYIGK